MDERLTTLIDTLHDEDARADQLAALDDAQIADLDAELVAAYAAVRAGEVEGIEPDDLEQLARLRDARLAVCGEATRRYEAAAAQVAAAAEREAAAAELDAEMGVAEPAALEAADAGEDEAPAAPAAESEAGGDEDDEDEQVEAPAEAEATPEPVTAARPTLAQLARAPRPAEARAPEAAPAVTRPRFELLDGSRAVSMEEAAERVIAARESLSYVSPGVEDRLTVCRIRADRPDAQRLDNHSSPFQNRAKVDAITAGAMDPGTWQDEAIVASGGWCAPLEPIYDVFDVVDAGRPVRDGVPTIQVDRGGVRIVRSDGIAGITTGATGAVNIWDATTDATPGESTKGRQTMDCETIVDIQLDAIVTRMRFGNFQARAFPELVASDIRNAAGRHARVAEGELLDDWIGQINMDVTEAAVLGTWRDLRVALLQAASAMRSRQRTAPDAMIGVWLPGWVVDAMLADVTRQQASGEVAAITVGREAAIASLRAAGINPRFYWDTPSTGTSQVWGAQGDGVNLRNWPTVAQALLYFEGSLAFGDGGLLNVGIVRDSTLNNTNDYELFSETFEAGIYLGPEAMNLSLTHCPNGESQVATDETGSVCTAS